MAPADNRVAMRDGEIALKQPRARTFTPEHYIVAGPLEMRPCAGPADHLERKLEHALLRRLRIPFHLRTLLPLHRSSARATTPVKKTGAQASSLGVSAAWSRKWLIDGWRPPACDCRLRRRGHRSRRALTLPAPRATVRCPLRTYLHGAPSVASRLVILISDLDLLCCHPRIVISSAPHACT